MVSPGGIPPCFSLPETVFFPECLTGLTVVITFDYLWIVAKKTYRSLPPLPDS
jgi:hypothetical protein